MPGDYSGNFEFEKIEGTDGQADLACCGGRARHGDHHCSLEQRSIITIQGEDNIIIRDLTLVGGDDGI